MNKQGVQAHERILSVLVALVLATICVVGLWPFHAPRNGVIWLANEDGLQLDHHGSLVTQGAFQPYESTINGSGTIEVWLEGTRCEGRQTILAFDGSGETGFPFLLQQNGDSLIVQRRHYDNGTYRTAELVVGSALREKRRVFVSITLAREETSVYLNGVLTKTSRILGRSIGNFNGRLVVGSAPNANDNWSGKIVGLAVYRSTLTPESVLDHFQDWTEHHRPRLAEGDRAIALYLFSERGSSIIHNQVDSASDLIIPRRYFVLHPAFLPPPWRGYHGTWSYWINVGINVAGFIPFGFCLGAYFTLVRPIRSAVITTMVLGFVTSLTIEVLQAFLPTRDSGMNDLITNTIGTVLGVMFYRYSPLQGLVANTALRGQPAQRASEKIEIGPHLV